MLDLSETDSLNSLHVIYRATGLDVVILKEEMGSRGKMGFLARLA